MDNGLHPARDIAPAFERLPDWAARMAQCHVFNPAAPGVEVGTNGFARTADACSDDDARLQAELL
ncbi:MAG: hypothetical protein AAFR53_17125 [Pseudomonadota bacterium]